MNRVALVTGGARRIGACIARTLHHHGCDLAVHYRSSAADAEALLDELNGIRPGSAALFQADLGNTDEVVRMAEAVIARWNRLDALVNNASNFYPTPLKNATEREWHDLMDGNLKGAFFLSQALAPHLRATGGTIVNIADISTRFPVQHYPAYTIAKGGVVTLTKSLALELAPEVRVNAIAPGSILPPSDESPIGQAAHDAMTAKIPLGRRGRPEDIARLAAFLSLTPGYITGQTIAVDGGLNMIGNMD